MAPRRKILPDTSGTTDKPKACMQTHRSALFTAVLQARWYGMVPDDVMAGFMPLLTLLQDAEWVRTA